MSFISWPEIESFSSVRNSVVRYPELLKGKATIQYRGKIKLHGTNASIQVREDKLFAQSRTRIITPGDDNAGFAAWVEGNKAAILGRIRSSTDKDLIVWGEWCGKGIMSKVAISQIPGKVFAVFAAAFLPIEDDTCLIVDDKELGALFGGMPDTQVLPWHGEAITVPMLEEPHVVQPMLDAINKEVEAIDASDPWVKAVFNVDGCGEGLVYYPVSHNTRKSISDLMFKAKGEKHKVVEKAKPAQLDPSVAEGIEQFASMVLTEARIEQGARTVAGGELRFDKKLIGPFLAWVIGDVKKETVAELEASKLEWKMVQGAVSAHARKWYLEKESAL